jgi:glutathione S-transferase
VKLYGFPFSPNTRRALFMLHEVNAVHGFVPVDITQGAHRAPEYLKLNPNARVPCLVDQDFVLWESNAILQYLAARFPEHHLDGERPRERAGIACWLFLNAAHLGPAFAHVFSHSIRLPEDKRIPQLVENGRAEAAQSLGVMDAQLSSHPYLAGNHFTIADVSVAATTAVAPMLGIDLGAYPNVAAWEKRVHERPAYKKVFTLAFSAWRGRSDHASGSTRGGFPKRARVRSTAPRTAGR